MKISKKVALFLFNALLNVKTHNKKNSWNNYYFDNLKSEFLFFIFPT
jgi:hypothetical protein